MFFPSSAIYFYLLLIRTFDYSNIRTFLSSDEEPETIRSLEFLPHFVDRSVPTVGMKIGLFSRYGPFGIPLKSLSVS